MTQREHDHGMETLPSLSRPGILTAILLEATGLSMPDGHKESPNEDRNRRNLPYAILDFDKSQKKVSSFKGTREDPVWVADALLPYGPLREVGANGEMRPFNWNFDVCRPAELSIYLYLGDTLASSCLQDHAFLGVARIAIDPSQLVEASSQWIDVQHGTGQLRISLEYKDMKGQTLEAADFGETYMDPLPKKDTMQRYTNRTIPTVQRLENVNHPFIAPLTLAFQSQKGFHLLSPAIEGEHLFHYLQKQQSFNLESAQFYAAEILCALEYLHDTRGIYSWLKPRNVLLDCFGHIVLRGSGLYQPAVDGDRSSYGMPEYPSPEVLLNQGQFRAADWWTLGIFLYEMLTGIPLFFDESGEEIRRKILSPEPIQVSEALPPSARDIITRLLEREPNHRLGAKGGASEVKEHPFFAGIEWPRLLQRNYEAPFKPDFEPVSHFQQHGVQEYPPPPGIYDKEGNLIFTRDMLLKDHEPESNLDFESDDDDDAVLTPASSQESSVESDDGWRLVWEEGAPGELYFHHGTTGDKKSIPARALSSSKKAIDDEHGGPSTSQKQDALEAALKEGHDHIVSQIVSCYGIDLNVRLFGYNFASPLGWAVDHGKLHLVRLMLDNGADLSFPDSELQGGPVLARAVAAKDRKLIEFFLQRSPGRVDLTRALGLAIDQRDRALAQLLLANGARSDFEEGDRPLPIRPNSGCYFGPDVSLPEEFVPPLARAVKLGDVSLVRLLLSNGANPNVGYHDLHEGPWEKHVKFTCGRVIQLAMELGRYETMKLLLAAGADIHLAQPVWRVPGHVCWQVTRIFYQSTMSKLTTVVHQQRQHDEGQNVIKSDTRTG
ncbi:protein kinase [Trichoderma austrokoningii]